MQAPNDEAVPSREGANMLQQKIPSDTKNISATNLLRILASFLVLFNIWGFVNAFGAFMTYYQIDLLSTYTPSQLSWIGSIQGGLLLIVGVLTGPIFDRGYFQSMLVSGALLFIFGLMMLSLASQYYQIFLAQGVCLGVASGILFTPSLALVATSFTKRKGLATSVAMSGIGMGGVVYPIMFRCLQPRVGFPWTTRIMLGKKIMYWNGPTHTFERHSDAAFRVAARLYGNGFVALGCFLVSFAIMLPQKPRVPGKSRKLFDPSAIRDGTFMILVLASFLSWMALYVPLFYIPFFGEIRAGISPSLSFYTLAISNAGGFFGRILTGYCCDIFGPVQITMCGGAMCALLMFSWIAVHDTAGFIVWAFAWGLASGYTAAVFAAIILFSPSKSVYGARLGIGQLAAGVATIIGNPIAGALAGPLLQHFLRAQVFSGTIMIAGVLCNIIPLMHILRKSRKQWTIQQRGVETDPRRSSKL